MCDTQSTEQRGERQRPIWVASSIQIFFWVMKRSLESRAARSRSYDLGQSHLVQISLFVIVGLFWFSKTQVCKLIYMSPYGNYSIGCHFREKSKAGAIW